MGVFSDIWEFIKNALRRIGNFLKKIFNLVYKGVKFIVECLAAVSVLLKNTWYGKIIDGLSFIFDLLEFLENKGADVNADEYKRELLDMDLDNYGRHTYEVKIS